MFRFLRSLFGKQGRSVGSIEVSHPRKEILNFAQLAIAGASDHNFNYGMESLQHVDEVFNALTREDLADLTPRLKGYSMNWGAYIGEVLRRRFGGRWLSIVQLALPASGGYELVLMPGIVAYSRIAGRFPLPLAEYGEVLAQDLSKEPSVAELMARRVQMAESLATRLYGITLDYSMDSLEAVDRILADVAEALPPAGEALANAYRHGLAEESAYIWGAYVGEVILRRWPGAWSEEKNAEEGPFYVNTLKVDPSQHSDWTIVFPIGKAYKRIENGPEDSVWFFVQSIEMAENGRTE